MKGIEDWFVETEKEIQSILFNDDGTEKVYTKQEDVDAANAKLAQIRININKKALKINLSCYTDMIM